MFVRLHAVLFIIIQFRRLSIVIRFFITFLVSFFGMSICDEPVYKIGVVAVAPEDFLYQQHPAWTQYQPATNPHAWHLTKTCLPSGKSILGYPLQVSISWQQAAHMVKLTVVDMSCLKLQPSFWIHFDTRCRSRLRWVSIYICRIYLNMIHFWIVYCHESIIFQKISRSTLQMFSMKALAIL